jgi:hypothetical protein
VPAQSCATRIESAAASTNSVVRGRSRRPNTRSPPQDQWHDHRREETCRVSALTPHLRAIQCLPTSKSPTSTNTNPSRTQGVGCWGNRGHHDVVPTHRSRPGHTTMAPVSTSTLHRRLGRFQLLVCHKLLVPLQQAGAAVGSQIHQVLER